MRYSNQTDGCKIWPGHEGRGYQHIQQLVTFVENSPRAGGGYEITIDADYMLSPGTVSDKERALLTTMLIDERERGTKYPRVTTDLIERAKRSQPMSVARRAERLLQFISSQTEAVSSITVVHRETYEAYAWTESIEWEEVFYLANYLRQMEWIRSDQNTSGGLNVQLTVLGHERIAEQRINVDSSQAFVAMWFDDSMNEAYRNGIKSAIIDARFKPMKIDQKEHINKIDDEIIAEIRRSRFLVADFTQGEDGARGGVYYEASFARGLGVPVISTCRLDSMKDVHFDTNHYNHIIWKTPEELREKLKNRILAVIGEGPEGRVSS